MNKYMLTFWNSAAHEADFAELSPEAIQTEIMKWQNWMGTMAAQGKFVSTDALMPIGKTVSTSKHIITDGPFTEGKEIIGGYAIVQATDLDDAVELAKGCPIFETEGRVEVRQIQDFD
jgi:hypothetical protein